MSNNSFELISDLHKDARGFRPSADWFAHFESLSESDKQRVWDDLCDELHEEDRRMQAAQTAALARLITRIAAIRSMVAGATVQDAIRYLHDAHDTRGDNGYLEYQLGVAYGTLAKL
jgi:hypothetical protein